MNLKQLLTNFNPFKKKDTASPGDTVLPVTTETTEEPKVSRKQLNPKNNPLTSDKNWKLSEGEKQIIVSWFASGHSVSECVDKARDELNVNLDHSTITQYTHQQKWQELIKTVRKNTMDELSDIAGSHKKVRLSRHERVYDKAMKKNDLKNAMVATENQRKEMEEQSVNLVLNQYNILSDDELKSKHKEVMERISNLTTKGVIDVKPTNKTEAT